MNFRRFMNPPPNDETSISDLGQSAQAIGAATRARSLGPL